MHCHELALDKPIKSSSFNAALSGYKPSHSKSSPSKFKTLELSGSTQRQILMSIEFNSFV